MALVSLHHRVPLVAHVAPTKAERALALHGTSPCNTGCPRSLRQVKQSLRTTPVCPLVYRHGQTAPGLTEDPWTLQQSLRKTHSPLQLLSALCLEHHLEEVFASVVPEKSPESGTLRKDLSVHPRLQPVSALLSSIPLLFPWLSILE